MSAQRIQYSTAPVHRYTEATSQRKTIASHLDTEKPDVDLREQLVKVGKHQDKAAYQTIFTHFAPRLRAFANKLCGSEAVALELVQDTLLAVWQKAHLYSAEKGAPSTWIYTICRNLRYDMLRRKSYREDDISAEDLWPVLADREPDDDRLLPEHQLMRSQLARFYSHLSEPQLEVIRMVYLQDKPQQQVAEELDIPLGTVKSRLRLAVQKLRESMQDDEN